MTRKEEIRKGIQKCEWISKSLNLQSAFIEGAEYADKTMLDHACEWLSIYYPNIDRVRIDEFIIDFRRAMEGGTEII